MRFLFFFSAGLSAFRRRDQCYGDPNVRSIGDFQRPEARDRLRHSSSSQDYEGMGRVHAGYLQKDTAHYGSR